MDDRNDRSVALASQGRENLSSYAEGSLRHLGAFWKWVLLPCKDETNAPRHWTDINKAMMDHFPGS
jgi:hypothetical protein